MAPKFCKGCEDEKDPSEFYKGHGKCKACMLEYQRRKKAEKAGKAPKARANVTAVMKAAIEKLPPMGGVMHFPVPPLLGEVPSEQSIPSIPELEFTDFEPGLPSLTRLPGGFGFHVELQAGDSNAYANDLFIRQNTAEGERTIWLNPEEAEALSDFICDHLHAMRNPVAAAGADDEAGEE